MIILFLKNPKSQLFCEIVLCATCYHYEFGKERWITFMDANQWLVSQA